MTPFSFVCLAVGAGAFGLGAFLVAKAWCEMMPPEPPPFSQLTRDMFAGDVFPAFPLPADAADAWSRERERQRQEKEMLDAMLSCLGPRECEGVE